MPCWEADATLGVPCLHLVNAKWMRGRQRGRQRERQRMKGRGGEADREAARQACASYVRVQEGFAPGAHWGRGEGVGKGAHTPSEIQAWHCTGRPRACVRAQPLDHALTRYCRRPAPPPHTIDAFNTCHTKCGAVGSACAEGWTDWPVQGVFYKHAHRSPTPRPSCSQLCHQNATTDKSGTKTQVWGA